MSDYVILTDSTTDLTPDLVKELELEIIPMDFTVDGISYRNDPQESELSSKQFYDLLRNGKTSTTSQVSVSCFEENMTPFLEQGKDVLYLSFSSGLSGTFNSSRLAIEAFSDKYPSRKIITVDTLCASMGEGLLVYHAAKLRREGKSIEEVATWVNDNKLKLCHWFTVDDLNFLKRGGRVSGAAALVGTMLGIKPVLHVDNEGHLIPMEKVRGRKASLDALLNHMEKTMLTQEQAIFVSHGDCAADCEYLVKELRSRFGIKYIHTNNIGPVIGSHSGPGTVAVFFLGTER